jgi:uncharacterized protein (TIGR00369 family)
VTSPHRPFYDLLGLRVDTRTDQAMVHLAYRPELANSRGNVHGGATASLLDATLARAVRLHDPSLAGAVTVDITTHFLQPGVGTLTGTGQVVSFGRTIAVAEAIVLDPYGTRVARATGTFRLFSAHGASEHRASKEIPDAAQR